MRALGERDVGLAVWLLLGLLTAAVIAFALLRYRGALLFAIFLYYATRPLYRRLNEYIDHPDLTVTLTLLAVALPLGLVVSYAGVIALRELDQFLATHALGQYRAYLQPYLALVREGQLRRLWNTLVTNPGRPLNPAVRRVLGRVRTVLGLVVTILTYLFLMSVFLFYFLRDDYKLSRWFYRSVDFDERVVEFTSKIDDDLETIFYSNLAIVAVSAIIAATSYFGLNVVAPGGSVVSIPVLLGVLTGIATLIPIVGMKLVYVPYALYLAGLALVGSVPVWHPIAFFAVAFVVVDTIPDFFIRSYLSARSGVHMGLVLLGYVLGTMAFGWTGLFLGPLVVVVAVHFARSIFPVLAEHVSFS